MRTLPSSLITWSAVGAIFLLACTQDFEQYRPGNNGGNGGNGGTPADGGGGSPTVGGGGEGGVGGGCVTIDDCPVPDECSTVDCVNSVCETGDAAINTPCAENSNFCDGAGNCVECTGSEQCPKQVCNPVTHVCEDPPDHCTDQLVNEGETDLNCGGGGCPLCDNGQMCAGMPGACTSNFCNGSNQCAPCVLTTDCDEAVQYCDLDIASGSCVAKKQQGDACDAADECPGDRCVDDFCCDTDCTGTCMACDSQFTAAASGTCANVDVGTVDPHNDCNPAAGCGNGFCSGVSNTCNFAANNTPCGSACTGFTLTPSLCNGMGQCNAGSPAACPGGHNCGSPTACDDDCNNDDAQCQAAFFCENSAGQDDCSTDKANGQACMGGVGGECTSGNCVDGVCCDTACTGNCNSCLGAQTGGSNGTCAPILAGTDPGNDCAGGSCTGLAGLCCSTECAGACEDCRNTNTGLANGTCGDVLPGLDPDNECTNPQQCAGDGNTCCDEACAGLCRDCRASTTGGDDGTCDFITDGTDPDNECAGAMVCDGAGACRN